MYLKSIELNGFKSFPAKTRLDFEPGISCIVGPNGSGKSNLIDALRWVLGETSVRSIRGGKMEDVIFSGSKKRRPLGMAEVTLTLDNSDGYLPLAFTEVSVSRRITRNGPGEYFINGKACRLKELRELFMDTGMGVDGLSVINQGRINELISARPDERRELVEEAAGIIKYRDRKAEAGRRLADTDRHLERIGDIIAELSGRIEPLKRQAEKAEKFLKLRDEEDYWEIGISVKVLSEADDKVNALSAQIEEKNQQLLADESARLTIAAEAEKLRLAIAGMDEQLSRANDEYYRLQTEREKAEGDRRLAEAQLANSEESCQRLRRELEQLEQDMQSRRSAVADLEQHISRTEQEMAEHERLVLSGEGGDADLSEKAELLNSRLNELLHQQAEQSSVVAALNSRCEFRAEQAEQARTELQQQKNELEHLAAELKTAQEEQLQRQEEFTQLDKQRREQAAALSENENQVQRLMQLMQDKAAKQADAHFHTHSAETRINMLREMAAAYEGFFPGVKSLMSARRKGQAPAGLIGVVAELMDVPQRYQAALEAHLGANLQNIVCEDAASARAAVDYLKRQHLGRATFLPLDILQVRRKTDMSPALKLPGVCGRGSELVQVEERLRPAVDFLLNNVLVVENMDAALAAAKALGYRVSVVTLDGDRINPGASISGGSRNAKGADLLAQKSRREEAQSKLDAAQQEEAAAQAELDEARERSRAANAENDRLKNSLSTINNSCNELQQRCEQLDYRIQNLSERHAATMLAAERLSTEVERLEQESAAAHSERNEQQQGYQQLLQQIEVLRGEVSTTEAALSRSRSNITENKVALASSRQKLHGQQLSLERLQQELTDLSWEAEDRSTDLSSAEQQSALGRQAISAADEQLRALGLSIMEAEQQLEQARYGQAAESARLNELDKTEREHLRTQDKIKGELHQLEIRRERWQADFENEAAKLAEKFTLDLEQARLRVGETPARTVMITRLNQLRRDIAALGNVNVDAIEEYAEVSERHQFLIGQRDDMLAAKAQLNEVIDEMNGVMSQRFRQTFKQLSEAFGNSFVRLFGGGQAQLLLSEPDNILETGVEISVSLPGKKVSNYNLLSGGEKSLIGIALMFAMLTVRPTPFCVMDEVDAALDEANIDRFTAYLRDRSDSNQFIMISHRQSTMESAASLWGVTMAEEGVSKVLSVRLTGRGVVAL